MSKPALILATLLTALSICICALPSTRHASTANPELTLYCAASFREPVSEIIDDYQAETGKTINVVYNGSGALLTQIQLGKGDLYLPANQSYIQEAESKNLTTQHFPSISLTAVIVTQVTNSSIRSIHDLTKPKTRLSFANQTAAIGKHTRQVLAQNNLLSAIEKNITVTKPTVNNTIQDVSLRTVDAAIAWDAVAKSYPNIKTIYTPIFHKQPTSIAILKSSTHPEAARHFAKYLTASKKGIATFQKHGFNQ